MTISCTWDEFKRMSKEFHNAISTLDRDALDNAWKCLGLAYLGMSEPMWQHSAVALLKMEGRAYMQRKAELEALNARPDNTTTDTCEPK